MDIYYTHIYNKPYVLIFKNMCYIIIGDNMKNDINIYISNYHTQIENIIKKFNYPSNIGHLLYLIIPAFIYYYGIDKERIIMETFNNVAIKLSTKTSKKITAFYSSTPYRDNNQIKTYKYINLYNYNENNLIELIDNLIHEFNHAINSYKNEINIKDNKVYIRTGISFIEYDFISLKSINKDKESILEEVLNTKQTVDVINVILSIDQNSVTDTSIYNIVNSLKNEVKYPYESNSYMLHTYICKYLLDNKAFRSTFNVLRINGNIEDLEDWFDNVIGQKNSYKTLVDTLDQILFLTIQLEHKKIKFFIINKIKNLNEKAIKLINIFNENCNYK